jgi:hypothetical protein
VRAAIASDDAEVRDAGVRALADWPDATAAGELLAIARGDGELAHRVLALRAYVRVLGLSSDREPAATVEMLREALGLAEKWRRPAEVKLVVSGFGQVADPAALLALLPMLDREDVAAEAASAAINVAGRIRADHEGDATAALEAIVASDVDETLKARARTALAGGAVE